MDTYKLSLRDLLEMCLIRGIVFSHEAVRDWETKLTPALAESLWRRQRGKAEGSGEANELPHGRRRPFTRNQNRLHATRSLPQDLSHAFNVWHQETITQDAA
jgi:hypothetical protein